MEANPAAKELGTKDPAAKELHVVEPKKELGSGALPHELAGGINSLPPVELE